MEKEVKELVETLDGISTKVETYQKDLDGIKEKGATKEELAAAETKMQGILDEVKKDLGDMAAAAKDGQKKLEDSNPFKAFANEVDKFVTDNAEKLKALKDMEGGNVGFASKAVGTMLVSGNYSGGTFGLNEHEAGLTRIATRQPFLRELVSVRRTSKPYVSWAEQRNREGAAGTTVEGAAKNQIDFDIVERQEAMKKITAYIKASKESLDDLTYLRDEINYELMLQVALALDAEMLTGSTLDGLVTNAIAFSVTGTGLAAGVGTGVTEANNYDVIRAAAWQVNNSLFIPNYVVLNPIDVAIMELTKTSQGVYTIPPFMNASGRRIAGMTIIENTGVTAGSFLVGDFSKAVLAIREEMNIQVGYVNDDFTKNLVTILCEVRALQYVKTNHAKAFVYGTFTAAKSAIGTV